MFTDALSWFSSIGSVWFWLLMAGIAVVLLIWVLVERADRRDERRAEEEADAEAQIEPVAPVADAIIERLRKRDARSTKPKAPTHTKKPNSRRKLARHK